MSVVIDAALLQDEGPQHQAWRSRLKRAYADRLQREGFTENEIKEIVKEMWKGVLGPTGLLIFLGQQLWRLYKALRAFRKAKEDAGPEPPFGQ